jgi:Mg/Co/Ni transporter MgtE
MRHQRAPADPVLSADLDALTGDELDELDGLFKTHAADWTADLPPDAQARVLELLDAAKARAVQSVDSAAAGAAGQAG